MSDTHREFKDGLYGRLACLGKALSSPHRLEMLEFLAQGERTVDSLTPSAARRKSASRASTGSAA